jgi:hypothetical protein
MGNFCFSANHDRHYSEVDFPSPNFGQFEGYAIAFQGGHWLLGYSKPEKLVANYFLDSRHSLFSRPMFAV